MIKNITKTLARCWKSNITGFRPNIDNKLLLNNFHHEFSQKKKLTVEQIPQENKQIRGATITLGQQELDYFQTQGGISILEKVPGVQAESGELYVLKFRCSVCKGQSIRSFTKHSYHKGVVMVRCGCCQKIHLVADNLGWFQDTPAKNETIYGGKVQKAHDPVAIVKFLQAVLGVEKKQQANSKVQINQDKVAST